MQFQVPQFIEVEDKIFGPLTFRQFIFMAGAAGGSYLIWRSVPIYISPLLIAIVCGLAVAVAFGQYNGRPFISSLENGFFYLVSGKLYVWSNERKPIAKHEAATPEAAVAIEMLSPKVSGSKLHELAWSLDIKERISGGMATDEDRMQSSSANIGAGLVHTARDDMKALRS